MSLSHESYLPRLHQRIAWLRTLYADLYQMDEHIFRAKLVVALKQNVRNGECNSLEHMQNKLIGLKQRSKADYTIRQLKNHANGQQH